MSLSRRYLAPAAISLLASVAFGTCSASAAAPAGDAGVAAAVEAFRQAMLANDRKQLEALCADQLTYGHSTARVQNKQEFVDEASNGKTKWNYITLTDQSIQLAASNAMSRFVFAGDLVNVSDGKTSSLKFGVLMVWVKQNGRSRLLARQGYKI